MEFGSSSQFKNKGHGTVFELSYVLEVHGSHNENKSYKKFFFIGQSMDPGNEDQMQSDRKGLRSRQGMGPRENDMRDLLPPM